ncbi:MFS multidrug transporter [Penicillium lividum]|nr:MFS multidrug transporter [Penicillium lividum]
MTNEPHQTISIAGQIRDSEYGVEVPSATPPFTSGCVTPQEEAFTKENASFEKTSDEDPNVIEFDGPYDKGNPMNWNRSYKWLLTLTLGLVVFVVTFSSSVFSSVIQSTALEFNVSTEVTTLGTSLFVLGYCFGPIAFGPLSEVYGRRIPLFLGLFVMSTFEIGVAVAQNLYTILLCRFFAGFFGSAPLAVVGGTLADFWNQVDRGVALCFFAGATFVGPVAGPIVGEFVAKSYLGWRWTQYIIVITGFSFFVIGLLIMPETYAPVILQKRAKAIRFDTRNWAVRAKADERQINMRSIVEVYCKRPFAMLFSEPILLLVTLYMALIYGILYLFFTAYPISFEEKRGWATGVGALPFIAITVGVVMGSSIIVYLTKTRLAVNFKKNGKILPEERLPAMIIGGVMLPIGLFWWAWTSDPSINPWPQIIAGVPTGAGILMIFLQGMSYIIDVYESNANSALAANTFVRSWLGAGFPLFASAMYHNLGVNWATTLLAFLTLAMIPVPVLFYYYGSRIRQMSKRA